MHLFLMIWFSFDTILLSKKKDEKHLWSFIQTIFIKNIQKVQEIYKHWIVNNHMKTLNNIKI